MSSGNNVGRIIIDEEALIRILDTVDMASLSENGRRRVRRSSQRLTDITKNEDRVRWGTEGKNIARDNARENKSERIRLQSVETELVSLRKKATRSEEVHEENIRLLMEMHGIEMQRMGERYRDLEDEFTAVKVNLVHAKEELNEKLESRGCHGYCEICHSQDCTDINEEEMGVAV